MHKVSPLLLTVLTLALGTLAMKSAGAVRINEIHYAPDVKTEPVEFVELFNPDSAALDLSGWSLGGGIQFTFPAGTMVAADGYVVVAQNPEALRAKFGAANALGPWSGKLSNEGDKVSLRNVAGGVANEDRVPVGVSLADGGQRSGLLDRTHQPRARQQPGRQLARFGSGQPGCAGPDSPGRSRDLEVP